MLELFFREISIIAEIFILIPHLQRLLSMFERMSIFFDRTMNVISVPNEIFFQTGNKLLRGSGVLKGEWGGPDPTPLFKKFVIGIRTKM